MDLAGVGREVVELGDGVLPGASAIEPRRELIPAVGCSDRREGDPEERSHGEKEVNVRHQMIHHLALRDHSRQADVSSGAPYSSLTILTQD